MITSMAAIQSIMQVKFASNTSRYMPPLTGIRALAALLVLVMHTEQNIPTGLYSILPFFARGYLGVDFFFVLSGFIITYVYLSGLANPNGASVLIFLWHRFIRLYQFTSRFWPFLLASSTSLASSALS